MSINLSDLVENVKTGEILFLGIFLLVFLIKLIYDFTFTGRIIYYKYKKIPATSSFENLSLIFTVRNEGSRMKENLPGIISAISGMDEVVAVDDFSQDQTFTVLGILREQFPNLKISTLNQESRHSVKVSQNIALKAASYEWVIVLSPLVNELPEKWLNLFRDCLTGSKNMIIGYTNVNPGKGFYNHLYRIERFFQQVKSFSYILNGIGFIVSEENIAFRKSIYFNAGGFGKKINEAYANLELILNDLIRKKNTVLLSDPDAAIRITEKIRHGDYRELLVKYRRIKSYLSFWKRAALNADDFLRIFWPLVAIAAFVYFGPLRFYIAGLIFLKIVVRSMIIKTLQKKLNERKIFLSSLIYDGIMPFTSLFTRNRAFLREKKRRWRK